MGDVSVLLSQHPLMQKRILHQVVKNLSPGQKDISYRHIADLLDLFTGKGNRSVDLDKYLASAGGDHRGVPLFSNRGDGDSTEGITASNISISYSWSKGPQIVNSFERHGNLEIGTTDSSNISHIISLLQTQMTYNPQDVDPNAASDSIFVGTFSEMWINVGTVLGNDMSTTQTMLDTYYSKSLELDTNRDSVSSVDLNDEAMNLMQYSKSYNAACRLMTTIDSVLDKLINGTGH